MYDVTRQFPITLLELIRRQGDKVKFAKVSLGGASGSAGGSGTPPGGYDGQLAQRYVAYDITESIASGSVGGSGSVVSSLVDNLNRIRANLFVFNNATLPARIADTAAYGVRAYGSRDDHVHSLLLGANMSWVSGSLTSSGGGSGSGTIGGSGTANELAYWTATDTIGGLANSIGYLYNNGAGAWIWGGTVVESATEPGTTFGGMLWADTSGSGGGGGTGTGVGQALFTDEGTLTTGAKPIRVYNKMGVTKTISQVFLSANTAPSSGSIIVDIHKGGMTIFTTQSNRPMIVSGSNVGTSTTIEVASWADGQYLTHEIDAIGSGSVVGSDLTVHVVYS